VGCGFDSQPDDLDFPAKCFVHGLDTLKVLPDVLLVLLDSFKNCQIVLKNSAISYLHC
jgi:hypothetical protein